MRPKHSEPSSCAIRAAFAARISNLWWRLCSPLRARISDHRVSTARSDELYQRVSRRVVGRRRREA
jgi:hypothetical protein